jgi:uncharacterized membrane protein
MQYKKNYLDLKLYPNKSISIKGLSFISFIFTLLTALISIHFIVVGAWPIGIFFFLDLIIILFAFKVNYSRSQKYERIVLADQLLIKKKYKKGHETTIKIEPSWLRLKVYYYNNSGHLEIISKGKPLIIGSYLNLIELKKLAKEIKSALIKREQALQLNF